jgi:hypothetical protein
MFDLYSFTLGRFFFGLKNLNIKLKLLEQNRAALFDLLRNVGHSSTNPVGSLHDLYFKKSSSHN